MYHSIHARGENIEDAIKAVAEATKNQDASTATNLGGNGAISAESAELEDGELEEDHPAAENGAILRRDDSNQPMLSATQGDNPATTSNHAPATHPAPIAMPQAVVNGGKPEVM